jgi:hypothetical protein
MVPRIVRVGALFVAAISFCAQFASGAGKPADPNITFEYSNLFDTPCFAAIKTPVDTAAVEELRSRMDSWRERWERDAPAFFETTVKLTGQPFKFHEARAVLFTCPAFVAMSTPLILNVRRLLKTTAGESFMGPPAFSRLVFHEVLHRYVAERLRELPGATTPTLQKYKDEPQVVRSHLYNLSIMEMVFLALGREDDLNEDRKWMRTLGAVPGRGEGDLRRALDIIAKEGAANLVKELAGR